MATRQIAVQMFTIRDFCKSPEAIAESCAKLKKLGFGAVQVSGIAKIDPAELKKILDDNEIKAVATHTNWGALTEGLDELIDELKTLDCQLTAIGAMPGEFRNPEGLKPFAEGMNKAAEAMKAEGIRLGYHNHSFEFEPVGDKLLMEHLLNITADAGMFAEIDTYWVQHGGSDPAAWIDKVAGRIPLVHFKDMGILEGKQVMREVGEGNINWPRVLEACKNSGVQYYAIEQDNCNGKDPFDCLAASLKNMQNWGLE